MLFIGISFRVRTKYLILFSPKRFIPIFTLESLGPLSLCCASSLVTLSPTKGLLSMLTILSPARIPAFSAGPFFITF